MLNSEGLPGLKNDVKSLSEAVDKRLIVNDTSGGKAGSIHVDKESSGCIVIRVDSSGGIQLIKFYTDGHITAEHKKSGEQWVIKNLIETW